MLYLFWSKRCPHCQDAVQHLAELAQRHPWLWIQSYEISEHREHLQRYQSMARMLGQEARSVPAFFICGQIHVGWLGAAATEQLLLTSARACLDERETGSLSPQTAPPELGGLDTRELSLPVLTLVLAGLDAFNPCAFFVLLFLLSLLVHARSRKRMLLIGGTFVLISGLVYFLFMAAWLNLFLLMSGVPVITLVAGLMAIVIGLLNSKDFFLFKRGPSLSIPDAAKPGIFQRMRGLLASDRLSTLMLGTVTLAIAVNGYELLCTAGFPMVYTRALTLHQLEGLHYYLYLAFYNAIYITPLLGIVIIFTLTLGSRKLSVEEGRLLKLISGFMMLSLGLLLVFFPESLNQIGTAIALLACAIIIGWLGWWWQRRHNA